MAQISYTEGQTHQINDLKNYVEDYCQTNGIDPAMYTNALDGATGIDPALLNDPVFQAYWQLAYLQLMEIINPSLVQSLYSEVGEVSFDALYARADPELNEFIRNLVTDSPELMGFAAMSDYSADTDPRVVMAELQRRVASPPPVAASSESGSSVTSIDYVDEDFRKIKEEFKLSGMWDWLLNTEEGIRSSENFLMGELSNLDQQLADLKDALEAHTLSPEAFAADASKISTYREYLVGLIQNFENNLSQLMTMMSQIIKQRSDMMQSLSQNMRPA